MKFSYEPVTQKVTAHMKGDTTFALYGDLPDILGFGRGDAVVTLTSPARSSVARGDTRCFFLLQSTRSVSGRISHHDRCRVGSVRLSDSVAKKPISA